ncbi:MAG TPA: autotransporter-associated beta strand repeat-containing protein, partial [Novosphingobium sp.]
MDASANSGTASKRVGTGRRKLLSGTCGAALALACALPSAAWADSYTVNNEAELVAAINAANANADSSATITLGSSFTISGTLPTTIKPISIDPRGNSLTTSATITASGTALNIGNTLGTAQVTNTGSITGGDAPAGGAGGIGASLNSTTLVNSGTITAGTSNNYVGTVVNPGAGVSLITSTLINSGTVLGANAQGGRAGAGVFSNNLSGAASSVTNASTGIIRGGSDLTGVGTGEVGILIHGNQPFALNNSGLIEGGNGAAAIALDTASSNVSIINSGVIRAGAGGTVAIDLSLAPLNLLELRAGSAITGLVLANAGGAFAQTLQLGGSVDASFDMSGVGATAQYRGFNRFVKSGASTWTLTGNASGMPTSIWELQQGTIVFDKNTAAGQLFTNIISSGTLNFQQDSDVSVGSINGGSVIQSGLGTTTLAASAGYTYSGGTTITAGKLSVSSDAKLGNVAGALTIDGGTLQWTGPAGGLARTINWGANGGGFEVTTSGSNLTIGGPLLGGGALVKSGAGVLTLVGDNTYTGGTTIVTGTMNIGNGGTTGSVLGDIVNNGTLAFNRTDAFTYAGSITGTGGLSKPNTGALTLTGQNNYGAGTSISGGQLLITGGATTTSGGATSLNVTTTAPLVLGIDGAGSAYSTAAITGAAALNRNITVSVTNGGHLTTTTGDIALRASTTSAASTNTAQLVVDGVGSQTDVAGGVVLASTSTTNGKLSISAGGVLHTGGASAIGFATGNIRGTPTVSITGAGSNWTSTGSLTMSNGDFTLDQGGTASFASATFGTATLPATLIVSGADSRLTTTVGDLVIGSGTGTGELTLSNGGAIDVAGSLVLADNASAAGILNIGAADGSPATAVGSFTAPSLLLGSATSELNFNHTNTDYLFGAAISGAGAINQLAGDTNLTGASTGFTGIAEVTGGKLRVNGTLGGAISQVNVRNGAALGGAGTIGGDVFVDNGGALAPGNSPGTLTIAGDLTLSGGSVLDYEFGRSDVVGGPLNDLTVVNGNLTLDGTIEVTVTPGGSFDPGLYRVISYGGALTDNGLALGSMPGGSIVQAQTAIAGQVNLINIAGADVNFWDGGGTAGDNVVSGGTGLWQGAGGNTHWTLADGSLNTAYPDSAFAIFAAAPGTVTVDDSVGAVNASGMQFASNGYLVIGDTIGLTGSESVIRVGDGTADGANYTATIAADMTSAGTFRKTDLGTLVLTGTNHFLDGMQVVAGTLEVANGGVVDTTATSNFLAQIDANLVVTGPGSLFTTGLDMVVARNDSARSSITVNDQGQLTAGRIFLGDTPGASVPSVIDLTVDGAGSVLTTGELIAGRSPGSVTINVTDGGHVISGRSSFGENPSFTVASTVNVTVDGTGSIIDAGSSFTLGAGTGGTSSLSISNGGLMGVSAGGFGTIGNGGSSTALVTGAGSQLLADSSLGIGFSAGGGAGHGQLTIQDGGLVAASLVAMGYNDTFTSGSTGTLTILGTPGSRGVLETGKISRGYGDATITLDGGVLRATADSGDFIENLGSNELTVTLGAGGGFIDTNGHDIGIAPRFVGTSGLTKDGAGTLSLIGDNSYGGGTTINAGTLSLGDGGTGGSITGAVTNDAVLQFNRSDALSFAGPISGTGSVRQAGPGTTILTGTNSYGGATLVDAGTLRINGNQSAATGLTTVAAAATLGGSGVIGGSVDMTAGGTLAPGNSPGTLTINGDLTLGSASRLAFELGQAGTPGGALNDLVNVGGNLTLDGTIDVAVPAGGSFDIGLYRVFNYGGSLTDDGLALGTLPVGANVFVQTSIAGQVNLINAGSAVLNFWDGTAGPKFNGAVDGGNGVWQAAGADNWADATGAVNAAYANGSFAIFAGTAGTVTVDNGLGAVTASGLQFASNGYAIQGDALTLTGSQATIRVGDGTSGGAGYVATIAAELTGGAQVVKTDAGELVLTATNTYTGGTALNGGTLRIASDANLGDAAGGLSFNGGALRTTADIATTRAVALTGQGTFRTDAGTTLTLNGVLTGAGGLVKADTGTLVLAGSGAWAGGTSVDTGTLLVNGNFATATGLVTVAAGAMLGGTGTIGGSVTLNGTLAPGASGTGTLAINGSLAIGAGATLAYEFGQAGTTGGALNDLVKVGGNLSLDGTIDVIVPAGGVFDTGIYRVFDYAGTLTNNGLTLGALPAGTQVAVQTSIAGQVNLVNFTGLALNFWDGAPGPKNDGTIAGGSGTWQVGTGSDNWTEASGAINAGYANGGFAVFGGTGGTVTVDNGAGQVAASGMQFATGGYTITGGEVALTDPQSTIRVGDGSTAAAGYVATINAPLSGATELVKTDAGTLVLGGANLYTGGTRINGGTVQVANDGNLGATAGQVTLDGGTLATSADMTSARAFVMTGAGTLATANATTLTLTGPLSGSGALTKAGAGTLLLTGANGGYVSGVTVAGGTLAVTGVLGSAVAVTSGARLEGTGRAGAVTNTGIVAPGRSGFGALTVASYAGSGGRLEIEAALGDDASPTDLLVVSGATSGATTIDVINRGGLGGQTREGIKIVDVAGASTGTFTLDGDYAFQGQQAVIAGAYGYRLYKNGVATPGDGDWYLRSTLLDPGTPATPETPDIPLYQPGVPVYEAYGQTMLALTELGTMQERIGNRQWGQTSEGKPSGIWGRMEARRTRPNATQSTSLSDVDVDSWKFELGTDHVLSQRGDGAQLV